jgi:hypothetical protein
MNERSSASLWVGGIVVALIILGLLYIAITSSNSQEPVSAETGSEETVGEIQTPTTRDTTESGAQSGRKPIARTTGFAAVSSTTATVIGTVIPQSAETSYWFEYGPMLNFGWKVDARSAGAGLTELGAAGYITGLKPGTEYYFRIGARNANGVVYGAPYKFITEKD